MKPQQQTKLYIPGKQRGNCMMTTYASYLDLPVDECPAIEEFFEAKHPGHFWASVLDKWLACFGFEQVHYAEDPFKNHGCHDYYFAYGKSARGVSHQVIYRFGGMFYDPHPSSAGLIKPDGFYILKKI